MNLDLHAARGTSLALLALLAPGLASCALDLERAAPEVARFALVAERPASPRAAEAPAGTRLDVRPFHPVQAAASGQFVYRVGEAQFVTDFYRGYVARPELLITHAARSWLAASGAVGTVLPVGSRSIPTHVLEADLVELHVDFRNPTAPTAVVTLRYALLADGGDVVRTSTIRGAATIEGLDDDAQDRGVAEAQSEALADLLDQLEKELGEVIRLDGADR